jgi:hypothetical protein
MNRDETIALFSQGREAWNAWAGKMLAERRALKQSGRWYSKKSPWFGFKTGGKEMRAWMARAEADFSYCVFLAAEAEATAEEIKDKAGEADEGWHFPRPAIKSIQLKANAYFQYFVFPGVTRFKDATFTGNATFEHATFSGDAWFDSATFKRGAEFESATFKGNASFESVTFTGNAQFPHTSFIGKAAFSSAKFHGAADFENAVLNTSEINYALFKTKSYYSDLAIRAERYLLGGTIHET